jgi:hypothetical protein
MLAGRDRLRTAGRYPDRGTGVFRSLATGRSARDVAETAQRTADATVFYRLLSNTRHNTGHPVIWIEWLLSTLFDASLLTPEPPLGGSFFASCNPHGLARVVRAAMARRRHCPHSAQVEGDFLTLACEGGVR